MENMEEKVAGGTVRNLERVKKMTLSSYEEAAEYRKASLKALNDSPPAKIKIFRRNDGTFDLVWYKRVVGDVEVKEEKEAKKKRYAQPKN
jgi:hypothetical protein